jgi:hypothetical protein
VAVSCGPALKRKLAGAFRTGQFVELTWFLL